VQGTEIDSGAVMFVAFDALVKWAPVETFGVYACRFLPTIFDDRKV